jgi:hypothetical protein
MLGGSGDDTCAPTGDPENDSDGKCGVQRSGKNSNMRKGKHRDGQGREADVNGDDPLCEPAILRLLK